MKPRVLVLDDDEDNLLILEEALRARGFDVRAARCCAEARAALEAGPADVLVTDLRLQDGTALELYSSLGPRRPRAAVLVSGYGRPEDCAASLAAGFQAHLVKPVALDQLEATVRAVLAATAKSGATELDSPTSFPPRAPR